MDALDIAEELKGSWAPGTEQLLDWEDPDGPGPLIEGFSEVLKAHGADAVDVLRRELNPLTATVLGLAPWERGLGLELSETALHGDVEARRAQIMSRLREVGPPTLELIRTVLQPLWLYLDPSAILISEVDRDVLRSAWPVGHTRIWAGSSPFGGGPIAEASWFVLDDALVSAAGAQLDLTIQPAVDIGGLLPELIGPDGTTVFWNYAGDNNRPVAHPGQLGVTIRLYAKAFAGKQIFGRWRLRLDTLIGAGALTQADLFVEGFGRDAKGNDGLGAAKFHWAPVLEQKKLNGGVPNPGIEARAWPGALAAAHRLTYATRRADVVFWPAGLLGVPPPVVGLIPDDDNAIPDACVPD